MEPMRGLAAKRSMPEAPSVEDAMARSGVPREAPVRLPVGGHHLSDAELVKRAVEGDGWAEEALYRRYADLVLGLAKRLLGNRDEAADVAQDAFLMAFEKLPRLRDASTFKTWLMQIAVRYVHRRFRRRRLLGWLGLDASADEASLESLVAVDAPLEVRVELSRLDKVVGKLPPAIRVPWMLRYVEGMELTEVAALCYCSLATAKRRIGAAQARVARAFDLRGERT
jgi:RNA polymerase sigma-70 factor, ECF subfamily